MIKSELRIKTGTHIIVIAFACSINFEEVSPLAKELRSPNCNYLGIPFLTSATQAVRFGFFHCICDFICFISFSPLKRTSTPFWSGVSV